MEIVDNTTNIAEDASRKELRHKSAAQDTDERRVAFFRLVIVLTVFLLLLIPCILSVYTLIKLESFSSYVKASTFDNSGGADRLFSAVEDIKDTVEDFDKKLSGMSDDIDELRAQVEVIEKQKADGNILDSSMLINPELADSQEEDSQKSDPADTQLEGNPADVQPEDDPVEKTEPLPRTGAGGTLLEPVYNIISYLDNLITYWKSDGADVNNF